MVEDLRKVENGDRLKITTGSGEVFEGMAVDYEHDPADDYSAGWVSFPFEGELWEQVNDRVDSEVLHVFQSFERRTKRAKEIELTGTVINDEGHESVSMGDVDNVEVIN